MPVTEKGYKNILAFHGLDATKNSDEDVENTIANAAGPEDIEALKNRAEAGDQAVEELANRDLEKYANRIGDKAEVKAYFREGLINNRAGTIAVLEAMPEPTAPDPKKKRDEPIHNRETAGNPKPVEGAGADAPTTPEEDTAIKNRAVELEREGVAGPSAWLRAQSEVKAKRAKK